MHRTGIALAALATLSLLVGSALVFRAFDIRSHSASDTLRPFLLTIAPVWATAIWAMQIVFRGRQR